MKKLSYYKYKGIDRIKLIIDLKQILKIMFNKLEIKKDSINFEVNINVENKTITFRFKESEKN